MIPSRPNSEVDPRWADGAAPATLQNYLDSLLSEDNEQNLLCAFEPSCPRSSARCKFARPRRCPADLRQVLPRTMAAAGFRRPCGAGSSLWMLSQECAALLLGYFPFVPAGRSDACSRCQIVLGGRSSPCSRCQIVLAGRSDPWSGRQTVALRRQPGEANAKLAASPEGAQERHVATW